MIEKYINFLLFFTRFNISIVVLYYSKNKWQFIGYIVTVTKSYPFKYTDQHDPGVTT